MEVHMHAHMIVLDVHTVMRSSLLALKIFDGFTYGVGLHLCGCMQSHGLRPEIQVTVGRGLGKGVWLPWGPP